jgi:Flp pilus assembly pilin Flp
VSRRRSARDAHGQTFTEYVMVLGLISAIIVAVTQIVVPGVAWVVERLVRHTAIYLSSS